MEEFQLPNTDSPEVMQQAVAVWIAGQVWQALARTVRDDEAEQTLTEIYDRVYRNIKKTHGAA
ncbi:MAG: hypothetical protein ACH37Z_14370 [Anaerolineae bacterium]|nr:hypothetical protein [Ardenticatenia bacterium]MBK8538787.1 hypothetical protein [Ardenticatenia bacterium]HQZ71178.1 hypothetical protein [Anaerolineae bacterium]HRA21411.1 hypothetical protein [Anaerolineae bacterium]